MKKILSCCVLSFVLLSTILGSPFIREDILDDFGDPSGSFQVVTEKNLNGTFKTAKIPNGRITYSMNINTDTVSFVIHENGKNQDLSTAVSGNNEYIVKIKSDDDEVYTYIGSLITGSTYCNDTISVPYLCNLLARSTSVKIVISNTQGSYSLGKIDTSQLSGLLYDKTLYVTATDLYEKGLYEEARDTLYKMNSEQFSSYYFYNGRALLNKIFDGLYVEKIERLIQCQDYEEAFALIKKWKENESDLNYYFTVGEDLLQKLKLASNEFVIGDKGPAGGFIFYDCDADNSTGNADGLISSECGWRYLEAAPADIAYMTFGHYTKNGYFSEVGGTSMAIGTGKRNTEILANAMEYDNPASVCANYSYGGFDDWFLPSICELYLMYTNYHKYNKYTSGFFVGFRAFYWSSTEETSDYIWGQEFGIGLNDFCNRSDPYRVRPIRSF